MRKISITFVIFALLALTINAHVISPNYIEKERMEIPSKQEVRALLEHFCANYYDECFTGRKYIPMSLTVSSVNEDESTGFLRVRGKHSYKGYPFRLGGRRDYPDVDYKATIMPSEDGRNLKVIFFKWTIPLGKFREGWWESCERIVYLNH